MSVTTPSTGQKISDFSVGTVDADSYLIQARNGSTEKIAASQIGQYSNLNLLFNGSGGLETTSKSVIGAINEVNAKDISDIHDVNLSSPADGNVLAYDNTSSKWVNFDLGAYKAVGTTSSSPITCANSTYTECVHLTLDKGLYLFVGMLSFQSNTTGVRGINISPNSGNSGYAATRLIVNACITGETRFQTVSVIRVDNNSSNYYLNAWQNSGGNLNVILSSLSAVKIGM